MGYKEKYKCILHKIKSLESLPLLAIRLVLVVGFFGPARTKIGNIENIAQWFDSMGYPFPTLNAYLATGTESLGVILLFLGLGTRIISIPLMIVMLVAIFTVHLKNGFQAGSNGFEIPLYYFIMLFTLLVFGSGKISFDHLLKNKLNNSTY